MSTGMPIGNSFVFFEHGRPGEKERISLSDPRFSRRQVSGKDMGKSDGKNG